MRKQKTIETIRKFRFPRYCVLNNKNFNTIKLLTLLIHRTITQYNLVKINGRKAKTRTAKKFRKFVKTSGV